MTRDREVATVNGFFTWAVRQGFMEENPVIQRESPTFQIPGKSFVALSLCDNGRDSPVTRQDRRQREEPRRGPGLFGAASDRQS